MKQTKKKVPIGIQTFSHIRENDAYYYVDKTAKIIQLIHEAKYIFLSRPRRFGKSLTLDTIAELFLGNKALFDGLYAYHHWDWEKSYPVIRFNFAIGVEKTQAGLINNLITQIKKNAELAQVTLVDNISVAFLFKNLIQAIAEKHQNKVVILIDEYDKPILDNLDSGDNGDNANQENILIAIQMRDDLRDFYSVIKEQDNNIQFVNALAQIKSKHYADKYRTDDNVIYEIGVVFDKYQRDVKFVV